MAEQVWWKLRRTQSEHWLATRREFSKTNAKLFAARLQVRRLREQISTTIKRGRGRPREAHVGEWEAKFDELWREEVDRYERETCAQLDDARKPTKFGVSHIVACADFLIHPERFPKGNPSLEKEDGPAARMVWDGVKRSRKRP